MQIIATDCANKEEAEPMGKQIYETILPSEVTGVNIMRQNAADNYDYDYDFTGSVVIVTFSYPGKERVGR